MKTFIYTLSDPTTKVVRYVGKTINPHKRFTDHCRKTNDRHHRAVWISSLRHKHQKPLMEIIDEVDFDQWEYWEIYWISVFKSWGFDLVNGNDGGKGTCSIETREKHRINSTGKKRSPESIEKTASKNRGRKNTEECKKRISDKLKGRKIPPDALLRRAKSQSKPVIQYDFNWNPIKEYPSITAAKMELSPNNNGLSTCLKGTGKSKSWCGYKWKYKN